MSRGPNKPAYKVGRSKPPAHSRFKPGQSGNPCGRPKGSRNLRTILDATLSERVVVAENGKKRSLSKLEPLVRQLVNKAASGEIKNTTLLLKLLSMHLSASDGQSAEPIHGGKDDEELLAEMLAQQAASSDKPEDHQ